MWSTIMVGYRKKAGCVSKKLQLPLPERPIAKGYVLTCGQNNMGQLGLGKDVQEKTCPAVVDGLKNVVDVRAGGMHSLCLTTEGEVWSFGCNDKGALGRDTSVKGSEMVPGRVKLPEKCLKISAGDSHSACLLESGHVYAWGSFRIFNRIMGVSIEVRIKDEPVALLPDVLVADIASGADHLVILKTEGKMLTVGCGEHAQLGRVIRPPSSEESPLWKYLKPEIVISKVRFVEAIWATNFTTFFRDRRTKEIYAMGLNNYNQLAMPEKFSKNTLFYGPRCTEIRNVKVLSGGQYHTLIVKEDNQCYVIGRKENGRLGLGQETDDAVQLTQITELDKYSIAAVSCGDSQSFALTTDGKVFCWGMGSNHQLGLGSDTDVFVPTQLIGEQVMGKKVLRVDSGRQHTIFLVEDSTAEASEDTASVPVKKRKTTAKGSKA
ncbi:regulator of chromosome condensation-like isoform X1 [Lutzomyia longipalpis]|uniref:regulator of chromosome condensation-like isoform X1 n=1 Tax=Lutzomyia longipalpis TaxID=7200 RepID=UPI0024846410|nr:regulator of chromosome condensation-like isoform X1 [Lutzomyia longipalpis]